MKNLLTANLTTKTATDAGSAWTPPVFTFGESLTIALRFQRSDDGTLITPALDVRGLTAAFGFLDARPASGRWTLQIGPGASTADNTTGILEHDCSAAALQAAINALPDVVTAYGGPVVRKVDGSWFIRFGFGSVEVPLLLRGNSLTPDSYGRVLAVRVDNLWVHEIRLVQVPVAFTDSSEAVLSDPPTVTRVRTGGTDAGFKYNEVQALHVPAEFNGTYALKKGYARTRILGPSEAEEAVQAALVAQLGANVSVTPASQGVANVEFINALGGQTFDLLEVLAFPAATGDLTFTITFDRAPLLAWLRAFGTVTLPLEVRIRTADADEVITEQVAFRTQITVQRPVIFPDLAEVPVIDWLRPISPRDYIPFSRTTVITGHQFNRSVVGDGAADVFVVADGLATDEKWVVVRENVSPGRQLIDGVDFTVELTDANTVTVTALLGAPALDAWAVTIISAETVAAFAAGLTVTIGQVIGLEDRLAALETVVAELQLLVPVTQFGFTVVGGGTIEIPLPAKTLVFPDYPNTGTLEGPPSPLQNLAPAVHNATVTSLTSAGALPAMPDVAQAGVVLQNNTGAVLTLLAITGATGGATLGWDVAVGDYLASDGRTWFPVTRRGTTNSYFPTHLEREIWDFELNPQMLRPATMLTIPFLLRLGTISANTRVQYRLVVEQGRAPSQGAPEATAINLTTAGTGVHSLLREGALLGTFTANAGTDVITITGTMPDADDVITVSNSGGALPGGLAADTAYVVRDVSGATCKLAPFANAVNLRDIVWDTAVPLINERVVLGNILVPLSGRLQIVRAPDGSFTANKTLYGFTTAADAVPASAELALRLRLTDEDTENSRPNAQGAIVIDFEASAATLQY